MTELIHVLYEYAQTKEMPKYLLSEEYRESERMIRRQREALMRLSPELNDKIDDLIGEIYLEHSLELEAMFEAALATARQLPRL